MESKDRCRSFICRLENEREFIVEGTLADDPAFRIHSVYVGQHPKNKNVVVRVVYEDGENGLRCAQEIGLTVEAAGYVGSLAKPSQEGKTE